MYQFLDHFFLIFHTFIILFNLLGYLWVKTRRINLALLSMTAFSWFVLGIWFGIGYCPCTDWHWQIREELGYRMPNSYIKYLVDNFTGLDINANFIDIMTVSLFASAFTASIFLNLRDRKIKKREV